MNEPFSLHLHITIPFDSVPPSTLKALESLIRAAEPEAISIERATAEPLSQARSMPDLRINQKALKRLGEIWLDREAWQKLADRLDVKRGQLSRVFSAVWIAVRESDSSPTNRYHPDLAHMKDGVGNLSTIRADTFVLIMGTHKYRESGEVDGKLVLGPKNMGSTRRWVGYRAAQYLLEHYREF
ncbi:hypothetical protein HYX70_01350 [Candidatus Saccharibacteria bacterium]|nr:hypothetical protein [Candidatus Saccharibacteria bacterium]